MHDECRFLLQFGVGLVGYGPSLFAQEDAEPEAVKHVKQERGCLMGFGTAELPGPFP